jgi:hypothetical protein
MLPLYAARIEDLGQSDFVKVDCVACHHARAGVFVAARAQPAGQGARAQRAGPVPGIWSEGRGGSRSNGGDPWPNGRPMVAPVGRRWSG